MHRYPLHEEDRTRRIVGVRRCRNGCRRIGVHACRPRGRSVDGRAHHRAARGAGLRVKINRIGSAPLDECEVASVGKAREQKQLRRFGDDFIEVVVRRSISVSLDCSRR
jgi:hypothetical protein